jgi:hypothetical protein
MKLPNPLIIPATILLLGVTLGGFVGSATLSRSRIESPITTRVVGLALAWYTEGSNESHGCRFSGAARSYPYRSRTRDRSAHQDA